MTTMYLQNEEGITSNIGTVTIRDSYTSKLTLNMLKTVDANNKITWVDMGAEHDNYECGFAVEFSNDSRFQLLTSSLKDKTYLLLEDYTGFYPFTPIYKSNSALDRLRMSFREVPSPEQFTIINDVLHCDFSVYPCADDTIVYSTALPDCGKYPEEWSIDGLFLPYPEEFFPNMINAELSAIQQNGNSVGFNSLVNEYGEIATIKLQLSEEKTRLLVDKIRTLRASVFQCYFPDKYTPFSHIYNQFTNYFNCRLSNNVFNIQTNGYDNMTVTIGLQLYDI